MPQTQQDSRTAATIEVVRKMDDAVNGRDVDAMMALLTDDVVWETTNPAPDGQRFEGLAAVRAAGEGFFNSSPKAKFETEEIIALGDRAVTRWLYRWVEPDGKEGHVRGVDVYRLRDGKVAEILSYVKG